MAWDDELAALMPPMPGSVGPPPDASREVLGLAVPQSYVAFCERWGDGGSFLDEITLFGFGDLSNRNSLAYKAQQFLHEYGWLQGSYPDKWALPLLPAPGSLLPFGIDGNGDWFGWRVGAKGGKWPVAVLLHGDGMPKDTGLDFPGFMLAFARREFPTGILHPSVLALPLSFEPRQAQRLEA